MRHKMKYIKAPSRALIEHRKRLVKVAYIECMSIQLLSSKRPDSAYG